MFYTAWESKLKRMPQDGAEKITYLKKKKVEKRYIWKTESTNRLMKIIIIF